METFIKRPSKSLGFTFPDFIFVVFVLCVVVAVGFLGAEAFHEAKKTEDAKKYGEDISAWLTEAGKERFKKGYEHGACAGGTAPVAVVAEVHPTDIPEAVAQVTASPSTETDNASAVSATATTEVSQETSKVETEPMAGTWGACLKYMLAETEFKNLINSFFGEPPQFVPACIPGDLSLTGAIFLEKMTPTPPGSAIPTVNSPFTETDPIDQKLQLRLSICDKGAYPLKIAEFEF
jgi:hypothetical protein